MTCAWEAYLNILPTWLRQIADHANQSILQEIRLRIGRKPEIVARNESNFVGRPVTGDDLSFIVNIASRYSPWTSPSVLNGFITAPGGHRIGLCGSMVRTGETSTIRNITSACIRVARDFPGISKDIANLQGNLLIIGKPGSGKTTLLRDLIRSKSDIKHMKVAVVDERNEIFPQWQNAFCFTPGERTDVLSGCNKNKALEMLLRTMNPDIIALDEITAEEDCEALIYAAWCGVELIATVHANNTEDLKRRMIYRKLVDSRIFDNFVVMRKDKTWELERMVA